MTKKNKSKPLTPEEFAREMRLVFKNDDKEAAHGRADDLLCEMLKQLGYAAGVRVYEKSEKWYA